MKIDIKLSEKDNIEVKKMYNKTYILLGDIEIEIEDKKTAEYLLECLDNTISNYSESKEELVQKIDALEREVEDLQIELENEAVVE